MATSCFEQENAEFLVLVNHEKQYSLWPKWKSIPGGWQVTGFAGNKQSCLSHIESVWTDQRPQSLQDWMAQQ